VIRTLHQQWLLLPGLPGEPTPGLHAG